MTTLSKGALISALDALTKKSNEYPLPKQSTAYKAIFGVLTGERLIKPVKEHISEKSTRYSDNTKVICKTLDFIGVEYHLKNMNPEKGIAGLVIVIDSIIE